MFILYSPLHTQLSRRWDLSGHLNPCWLTIALYYTEDRQLGTRNKEKWVWEDAAERQDEGTSKKHKRERGGGEITRWAKATKGKRHKEMRGSAKHLQFSFCCSNLNSLACFCWPKIPPCNSICRPQKQHLQNFSVEPFSHCVASDALFFDFPPQFSYASSKRVCSVSRKGLDKTLWNWTPHLNKTWADKIEYRNYCYLFSPRFHCWKSP